MKHAPKYVGMLRLVGTVGLFATLATAAFAGPGQGSARQLTGKVTSLTASSITVRSQTASLRCAARAGLKLNRFAGKRVTMACREVAGKLVVKSVRPAAAGKAIQKRQAPMPNAPSPSDDDPADDDPADDDPADDDPADDDPADDEDGLGDDDPADDDEDCDDDGPGGDCDDDDDDDDEDDEDDEDDDDSDEED